MNYKLILFTDGRKILTSDEEKQSGDKIYHASGEIGTVIKAGVKAVLCDFPNSGEVEALEYNCNKIIAGIDSLPKLDISAIEEELGIVDVEKLAINVYPDQGYYVPVEDQRQGFITGFNKAQELNKNKYSEEDLIFLLRKISIDVRKNGYGPNSTNASFVNHWIEENKDYLQKQKKQPKVYNVTFEEEEIKSATHKPCIEWTIPKITNINGTAYITITKIIK